MTKRWNKWMGVGLGTVAAVVAVAAGATAITAASAGTGHHLLTSDDVSRQLAALPTLAASAAAPATNQPVPTTGDGSQVFRSAGGMAVVQCTGDTTTLLRWTPNTGFRADDRTVDPAHAVSVEFEGDSGVFTMVMSCDKGAATMAIYGAGGHDGGGDNSGKGGDDGTGPH